MKAFTFLTFLALLSVTSGSNSTIVITTANMTTPTSTPTPATTSTVATPTSTPTPATTSTVTTPTSTPTPATTSTVTTPTSTPTPATTSTVATPTSTPTPATTSTVTTPTSTPTPATTSTVATPTSTPTPATTSTVATPTSTPTPATTSTVATPTSTPTPATTSTVATPTSTPTPATTSTVATPTSTPTPATTSTVATPTSTPTPATTSTVATPTSTPTPATTSTVATPTSTPTPATTSTVATPTSTPTPATTSTVATPTSTPTPATTSTVATPTSTPTPATTSTVATPTSTPTPATTSTVATPTSTPTPATTSTVATPTSTPTPATTSTVATPTSTPTPATTSTVATPTSTPTPATSTTITKGTPSSGPSSNVPSITTSNPNPNTTGLCQENSCASGSSCVNLNASHFCLCIDGYYYKSSQCNKGKVFPGTIQVKMSETSGLENEMSKAYEDLHMTIIKFFQDTFNNTDYGQTVIYKVRLPALARSEMRAGDKVVAVEVVNLFAENSEENEKTISDTINKQISDNSADFSSYAKQDRCAFYGCVKNGNDDCGKGFLCQCKPGLARPNPQTAVCIALGPNCPDTCKAEHNLQCVVKSDGNPDCVCLPGYQRDDRGTCQACSFGYSGVDCKDAFQLILTILGTIAGILILGLVIGLICMRSKIRKSIEEQNLIDNDFQNLRLQYTTGFSNSGAEGSIFPKVRANFPSSQPHNPYAQRSMPRPDY